MSIFFCLVPSGQFLVFIRKTINLELNGSDISTTKNSICVNAVFSHHVDDLETGRYLFIVF